MTHDAGGSTAGVVVFNRKESAMGHVMKKSEGAFAANAYPQRSEFELAAARAALRSIQESIGSLERLRAEAGSTSWLRPPTKW
jgi:hypothetical protein